MSLDGNRTRSLPVNPFQGAALAKLLHFYLRSCQCDDDFTRQEMLALMAVGRKLKKLNDSFYRGAD